ncbi:MAG: hypothetical protein C0490_18935 [Marivirga sp.]|nr:hypothetical protein [Marivirga sp.]
MKGRYVCSLVSLLLWAATSSAQTELSPKEEYKLLASASTISVARGQQDSVRLWVLRSKSFKTGKASIALNPPAETGLSVSIKQAPNQPDVYMLYVSATAEAKTGEYNFVPTCTLRNKSKGVILKLIIH